MHPLHWIYINRDFLQALSGLTIAVLTIVLIFLNVIYVRANWKTMRLMEADVRFRLKPIPHIGLQFLSRPGRNYEFYLTVRAEHAPMRLVGADVHVAMGSESKTHTVTFNQEIIDTTTAMTKTYEMELPRTVTITTWQVTLFYRDLSGFLDYATDFDAKGFIGDRTTIDRHSLYNKTRFWILRVWHRKEMSRLVGKRG